MAVSPASASTHLSRCVFQCNNYFRYFSVSEQGCIKEIVHHILHQLLDAARNKYLPNHIFLRYLWPPSLCETDNENRIFRMCSTRFGHGETQISSFSLIQPTLNQQCPPQKKNSIKSGGSFLMYSIMSQNREYVFILAAKQTNFELMLALKDHNIQLSMLCQLLRCNEFIKRNKNTVTSALNWRF